MKEGKNLIGRKQRKVLKEKDNIRKQCNQKKRADDESKFLKEEANWKKQSDQKIRQKTKKSFEKRRLIGRSNLIRKRSQQT